MLLELYDRPRCDVEANRCHATSLYLPLAVMLRINDCTPTCDFMTTFNLSALLLNISATQLSLIYLILFPSKNLTEQFMAHTEKVWRHGMNSVSSTTMMMKGIQMNDENPLFSPPAFS